LEKKAATTATGGGLPASNHGVDFLPLAAAHSAPLVVVLDFEPASSLGALHQARGAVCNAGLLTRARPLDPGSLHTDTEKKKRHRQTLFQQARTQSRLCSHARVHAAEVLPPLAPFWAEAFPALGSKRQHPLSGRMMVCSPTVRARKARGLPLCPCTVCRPARWDHCHTTFIRCCRQLYVCVLGAKMPTMHKGRDIHTLTHENALNTHTHLPPPARRASPPAANPSDLHTCREHIL
jgi:hypothetical protein